MSQTLIQTPDGEFVITGDRYNGNYGDMGMYPWMLSNVMVNEQGQKVATADFFLSTAGLAKIQELLGIYGVPLTDSNQQGWDWQGQGKQAYIFGRPYSLYNYIERAPNGTYKAFSLNGMVDMVITKGLRVARFYWENRYDPTVTSAVTSWVPYGPPSWEQFQSYYQSFVGVPPPTNNYNVPVSGTQGGGTNAGYGTTSAPTSTNQGGSNMDDTTVVTTATGTGTGTQTEQGTGVVQEGTGENVTPTGGFDMNSLFSGTVNLFGYNAPKALVVLGAAGIGLFLLTKKD